MKKLVLFLLFTGAALAGIALWVFYPRAYTLSEHKLQFTHLQRGDLREAVSATGRLEMPEVVAVPAEIPGTVVSLFAKINDTISAGTLLARLDDKKARLDVDEASIGVETAKAGLAQARAMKKAADLALDYQVEIENKGGFRSERDQAKFKVEAAEAGVAVAEKHLQAAENSLKKAQDALSKTQIRVPLRPPAGNHRLSTMDSQKDNEGRPLTTDGQKREYLVLDRKIELGQFVGPQGPPLFLLTGSMETMEVHAQVAEGDIAKVRKGLESSFSIMAHSEEDLEFRGKVKEIRPMGINTRGAVYYDTVIEVANQKDTTSQEWCLRPGMTASVDIIRREHKNVWKIPTSALNFHMEEAYQSPAAQEHLAQWKKRPDAGDWQPVWIWDPDQQKPWPVFIRLGGLKNGEPALKDSEFHEILEWEPGREPQGAELPRIIIGAPPARPRGFFDQPVNIKVS